MVQCDQRLLLRVADRLDVADRSGDVPDRRFPVTGMVQCGEKCFLVTGMVQCDQLLLLRVSLSRLLIYPTLLLLLLPTDKLIQLQTMFS